MAINNIPTGFKSSAGIIYSVITDTSADWATVANSTYFYDKADGLVHYKNSGGTVVELFESGGSNDTFANKDLTLDTNRTHNIGANNLTFAGSGKLGLGETSPTSKFHIKTDDMAATSTSFLVEDNGPSTNDLFKIQNDGKIGFGVNGQLASYFMQMEFDHINSASAISVKNNKTTTNAGAGIEFQNGGNMKALFGMGGMSSSGSGYALEKRAFIQSFDTTKGIAFMTQGAATDIQLYLNGGYDYSRRFTFGENGDTAKNVAAMHLGAERGTAYIDQSAIIGTLTSETVSAETSELEFQTLSSGALVSNLKFVENKTIQSLQTTPASDAKLFNNSVSLHTDGTTLKARYKNGAGATSDLTIGSEGSNFADADLTLSGTRTHDLAGNNLIFNGSGNFGLGTTSPNSKLHVNGDISLQNGALGADSGIGLNLANEYLVLSAKTNTHVTIKTNIPFTQSAMMSSLKLTYWSYNLNYELNIGWYTYPIDSVLSFYSPNACLTGIVTDAYFTNGEISLSVENGKVNINIPHNFFQTFGNISVNSLNAGGNLPADWHQGWTIDKDAVPTATNQKTFIPSKSEGKNFFDSNLTLEDNRSHNLGGKNIKLDNGTLSIGNAAAAEYPLFVKSVDKNWVSRLNQTTSNKHGLLIDVNNESGGAYGLWVRGKTDFSKTILAATMNGRVGVGTSSPTETLDVAGKIKLSGASNEWIKSDGSIRMDIDSNNDQTDRAFIVSMNNAATDLFTIKENGNVGIGTTTPQEKLHINQGSLRIDRGGALGDPYVHLVPDSGEASSWMLGVDDSGNKLTFAYGLSEGGTPFGTAADKFTISSGGNVGIGVSAPQAKLDVNGIIRTDLHFLAHQPDAGIIFQSQNQSASSADQFQIKHNSGNVEMLNERGSLTLEGSQGDAIIKGHNNISFYTKDGSDYQKRVIIKKDGNVGIGADSPTEQLHVTGNALFESDNAGHFGSMKIDVNTNVTSILIEAFRKDTPANTGRAICFNPQGGNVGIGITNPTADLHVGNGTNRGGVLALQGHAAADPTLQFKKNDGTNIGVIGFDHSASTSKLIFAPTAVTTDQLLALDFDGKKVGVGTAAPTSDFHVSGATTGLLVDFQNPGGNHGLRVKSGNNEWNDGSEKVLDLRSGTTDKALLNVHAGGFVGIGTDTPNKELTVKGHIMLEDNSFTYWGDISANTVHSYIGVSSGGNKDMHLRLNNNSYDTKLKVGAGTNGETIFSVDGKGKMEVGNVANLGETNATTINSGDVIGLRIKNKGQGGATTKTGGAIVFDNTDGRAVAAIAGRQHLTNKDASELVFLTHSSATDVEEKMVLDQSGNLGIGTTAPSTKLHVNGDFRLVDGNQGAGKVLTSDAGGVATWTDLNNGLEISNASGTNYGLSRTITNGTKILVEATFTIDGSATAISNVDIVPQNSGGKKWFKLTRLMYVLDTVTSAPSFGFGNFSFPNLLNQGGSNMNIPIAGNSAGQFNYLEDTVSNATFSSDQTTSIEYGSLALPNISSGNVAVSYTPAAGNRAVGTVKMILEGYLV